MMCEQPNGVLNNLVGQRRVVRRVANIHGASMLNKVEKVSVPQNVTTLLVKKATGCMLMIRLFENAKAKNTGLEEKNLKIDSFYCIFFYHILIFYSNYS
jgi:hypothetical protein